MDPILSISPIWVSVPALKQCLDQTMLRSALIQFLVLYMILPNFPGVCYSYNMNSDTNLDSFQWDWTSPNVKYYRNGNEKTFMEPPNWDPRYPQKFIKEMQKFKDNYPDQQWELAGFMGANVLFNKDGVVFSTPLARSFPIGYGGESGTIILKKDNDGFIIANGKWQKTSPDLQNLAGSAIAKGNFYGTGVDRNRYI